MPALPTTALLAALLLAACAGPAPLAGSAAARPVELAEAAPTPQGALPSVALPVELAAVLRAYEAGWRARDADALAALFTADGFVLSSERPPVRGQDAIRERYAGSGGDLALRALAWEQRGDLAVIIGAYGRAPGAPDWGKFTLTLRREADGWRILSDMDNGNTAD